MKKKKGLSTRRGIGGFIQRHTALSLALLSLLTVGGIAWAVHDNDIFQLTEGDWCDGGTGFDVNDPCDSSNPNDDVFAPGGLLGAAGEDWETIWLNVTAPDHPNTPPTNAVAFTWLEDLDEGTFEACEGAVTQTTPFPTGFQGSNTKDTDIIEAPGWGWVDNTALDKLDLHHAFAAMYRAEVDATHDGLENIVYFGSDRESGDGDAQVGFWILKNPIGLLCDGNFSGQHAVGDVLVVTNFTAGGGIGTVNIYKWRNVGDGDTGIADNTLGNGANETHPNLDLLAIQQDCDFIGSADGPGCGSVNTLANTPDNNGIAETTPWPYQSKTNGNIDYGPKQYQPQTFFEGGINLDHEDIELSGCFSGFVAESRSSQSLASQRHDFTLGNFETCGFEITKTVDTDPTKVGDTVAYTITITNTGIESLWPTSIEDTIAGDLLTPTLNTGVSGLTNGCTGELPAPNFDNDPAASCTITYNYTIQPGDADPVDNIVTAIYNEFEDDSGTSFEEQTDATAGLFQPDISVSKSCDDLSKVGDTVDCTVTITNDSSSNAPDLVFDAISDTLQGDLTDPANYSTNDCGASFAWDESCTITYSFTVPGDAPDPIDNTVTVETHPDGFTNDVDASASDSVDLFQAAVTIDKTGDTLSKVGDDVDYTITVTNTSSAGTPDLTCDITDALLGLNTQVVLAQGAPAHVINTSYTVQQGDGNPLVNTADVSCTVAGGFDNVVSDSDDHSVDLFQPAVTIDKTGDTLSKVGDDVDYTITVTNTSSDNTPDLTCTVTDSLLTVPGGADFTLAADAAKVFNVSRTVQQGDPDPLPNTADVSCTVGDGFGNVVSDSDDHSVDLFQPAVTIDKTGDTLSKVGDDVDYTITVTNASSAGTPDLTCTVTDSLLTVPGGADFTLAADATKVFNVSRTVQQGDPDPLPNTADVSCTVGDGFGNVVSDSDDHSVDLFQPAVTIDKTGDTLSKVGDDVDYTITVTNASSAGTPDLTCDITDALTGLNTQVVLAQGAPAHVINTSYTVQQGDPDPLPNTADVSCTVAGFGNVVSASDGHSVDLFQPAVTIDKTGDTLSKVGDDVDYTITVTNASSAGTPDLTCDITDALLGLNTQVVLAQGAPAHVINTSYTVQQGDPDPLPNTANVSCTVGGGFGNVVGDSDGHSVELFQPSITFDKTGDTLSKVGDSVDYTITLTNTSSAGTPDLTCDITDALLGLNTQVVLAQGAPAHVINTSYTVQQGDPDPLPNTANVSCTVGGGFGNVVTASDDHSVDLIAPDFSVTKSCTDEPIQVGAAANFRIRIANTGDVPLELHIVDTVLLIDDNVTLGVVTGDGVCDELDWSGDPASGCYEIEDGVIVDVPGEFENNVDVTFTLDQALYPLPNTATKSAGDACTVEQGGATRTLGFWKTHGSDGDNDFPPPVELGYTCHIARDHIGFPIDIGSAVLSDCEDVFGVFMASPGKESDGSVRKNKVCKAKVQGSWIYLAATLNQALDNGAALDPVEYLALFNALAGNNFKDIKNATGAVNDYNESGDDVAIIDNDGAVIPNADPTGAKSIADTTILDCN